LGAGRFFLFPRLFFLILTAVHVAEEQKAENLQKFCSENESRKKKNARSAKSAVARVLFCCCPATGLSRAYIYFSRYEVDLERKTQNKTLSG